jgi:cytochrome c biogenesis protein CcdA/thiol-disulfide isomerase/thioredoxin
MLLFVVAYIGGVLTIVSPCILPVIPFVFARADRPFLRSGLPMLVGMAAMFSAVATLAAVGGGWAVAANQYGRIAAMVFLGVLGIALLVPALSDRLTAPAAALGARLSRSSTATSERSNEPGIPASFVLGAATGLLWAPCAGPVLGLVLTGAALQGANVRTSLLLLAFAAGAATSLALALVVGGRVLVAMKRALGASEWIRRGLGVAVVAGVAAIALGLDTGFLTRVSVASTTTLEQRLLDRWPVGAAAHTGAPASMTSGPSMTGNPSMAAGPSMAGGAAMTAGTAMAGSNAMTGGAAMSGGSAMMMSAKAGGGEKGALNVEGRLPSLAGAAEWLNSTPLTSDGLRGTVVVVDFWTYSCINCLRAIPYVRAWADKYADQGLVVIGVHSPEFAFEKNLANVRKAVADLHIRYPVAVDNGYAIWRAFQNQYWPAHYFIDASGRIRHHHFGEGGYDESEQVIQRLLAEAGRAAVPAGLVAVNASGAEAAASEADVQSPETYVGFERAERFVSPGGAAENTRKTYTDGKPRLNEWGLAGAWTIGPEHATLEQPGGGISYRFHARDLHLVLAAPDGKPVRFRVTIDGGPPGDAGGVDVNERGEGVVTGQRLYQLIRQRGAVRDLTFEVTFLDGGVQAYAFTFG